MREMKKLYSQISAGKVAAARRPSATQAAFRLLLSFTYLGVAAIIRGPGVAFHAATAWRAARRARSSNPLPNRYGLIAAPLDSFRYFEFDFFWQSVTARTSLGDYLDVSSPRLFSWRVLALGKSRRSVISNPDKRDLEVTAQLLKADGLMDRCELRCLPVSELDDPPGTFDTVACISVLEHIAVDEAPRALTKMWSLVKPGGGRLLLSVPCAKEGFEEYIDWNEYGLLPIGRDGYVFGQRFYDQAMLAEQIYSVLGQASRKAIFGEKAVGTFMRNRSDKLQKLNYPFWREPLIMATQYRFFDDVDSLPGVGVIAFEFVKP